MLNALQISQSLIPVTQFNKGQATKVFAKLKDMPSLIVLKNNIPTAFILSPKEYNRLSEIEENYYLLQEAFSRLSKNQKTLSEKEVMEELNITQNQIDAAEDVEIE